MSKIKTCSGVQFRLEKGKCHIGLILLNSQNEEHFRVVLRKSDSEDFLSVIRKALMEIEPYEDDYPIWHPKQFQKIERD